MSAEVGFAVRSSYKIGLQVISAKGVAIFYKQVSFF